MFDFAWTEIGLIGVVALVLIGPKDMPVAIKAVSGAIKKARRMAAEFQTHVDDMVRDTELAEVRKQIDEIRNFDIRGEIERAVDDDGSLKQAFTDPFAAPAPAPVPEVEAAPEPPAAPLPAPIDAAAPAFIPPAVAASLSAPAFIPPHAARGGGIRPPFA